MKHFATIPILLSEVQFIGRLLNNIQQYGWKKEDILTGFGGTVFVLVSTECSDRQDGIRKEEELILLTHDYIDLGGDFDDPAEPLSTTVTPENNPNSPADNSFNPPASTEVPFILSDDETEDGDVSADFWNDVVSEDTGIPSEEVAVSEDDNNLVDASESVTSVDAEGEGWKVDPYGRASWRWFDGSKWTGNITNVVNGEYQEGFEPDFNS